MAETLKIIFENFWTFSGTIIIILSLGNSLAIPFYWYYKIKQNKLNKSVWHHQ
jgi:hypothetical protein